ncbi:DNA-directed RNA polymerase I subunit RPA2-like [Stylophora pistillata]|uniref:DNA-directed RNA polymerase I subunit RPA2-like n=1 Tax=Stylophora pistillata TaxID=50429 RepID=UPI000C04A7DC|nr:DNA-directed RNA polymerase I subunit RPA2-like [Stylophora pistillata]
MATVQDQNSAVPNLKNLNSGNFGKLSKQQNEILQGLVNPHIQSFNFMLEEGLSLAAQAIHPQEFLLADGQRATIYFTDASVGVPTVSENNLHASQMKLFPSECRERGITYKAKLQVTLQWKINNKLQGSVSKVIASIPMMVKSKNCSLAKLSPQELVHKHEEAEEAGGYFIVNGLEKLVRMLILPRRNFPLAVQRPTWKGKGAMYTEYGVQMRSVRKDHSAASMILHYLSDGSIMVAITLEKEVFYVPLVFILKALVKTTDQQIYHHLVAGEEENSFLKDCIATMLRSAQSEGATTQQKILKFIGERFRIARRFPDWYSDEAVAQYVLQNCVCVHLNGDVDKFNLLIFMARKLYAFAFEKCAKETSDNPMMQEVLLGGHLYLMILKEKLESWLYNVRFTIEKDMTKKQSYSLNTASLLQAMSRSTNISHQMEYFLATGNLVSRTGLAVMQSSGFTVVAERLNFYRFLSHFRCVHRGAFFAQMRTTSVRKLLPEAWGFLCPVHTPDGAPCGLLNHLAASCQVVNDVPQTSHLPRLLCSLGMTLIDAPATADMKSCYMVVLDGRVIGRVDMDLAPSLANRLRMLKVLGQEEIPQMLEICLVPITKAASQYPGLYIFSTPARFMRPVLNLAANKVEMIGTFEQVYMNIAVVREEAYEVETTHLELKPGSMLSAIASLTPFSDFNQSPRNMYQCQMGKQTMGTPVQALKYRSDNKLYRIQTPQSPLVRPVAHEELSIDNYALGTNAVVAVISYTVSTISFIDDIIGQTVIKKYSSLESAIVEDVKILGNDNGTGLLQKASIKLRIQRNPIIGDKFASRHGQKGISQGGKGFGRKRQGGIRFGEMERDALLAHGTSYLLQDRLMNCSDRTVGHVCTKCGSILSPLLEKPVDELAAAAAYRKRKWICKVCESSVHVQLLAFPYVFRYLVAELAGMNIKTCLQVKKVGT